MLFLKRKIVVVGGLIIAEGLSKVASNFIPTLYNYDNSTITNISITI